MKSLAGETLEPAETPRIGYATHRSRERWMLLAAAALAGFYLVTSIQIASHRLLWFDEIVTVLIAGLPNASRIVDGLAHVDNNMPPPYFMVVHFFFKLLGVSATVARLPSALALIAGMLITFDCVRRLTDGLNGLLAMSVLGCSALPYYGYEARSYGIYFMLAAFCFWIWVHGKGTKTSALLFGAAFFLAIMVHYYAVLGLVPYAAWEASSWRKWRLPSANLIAGGLAACAAAAVLVPQMSGAKRYSAVFWSPPTSAKLQATFTDLIPQGPLLLAFVLIWIALTARPGGRPGGAPMQSPERIGWLGLLIPFAGYALAKLVTNAYVSRYFLAMLSFIAVAFSCWVWRNFRETPVVSVGILLILVVFATKSQLFTARHPEFIDPYNQQTDTRQALQMEHTLRAEGKHFTVMTNGLLYLPLWYYAKHPEEYVLLVPSDEYLEAHNTARYVAGLRLYFPIQCWNPEELRRHAAEAALIAPTEDSWRMLKQAGLEARVRFAAPLEADYFQ
jgi:uncharacterized membrane protein